MKKFSYLLIAVLTLAVAQAHADDTPSAKPGLLLQNWVMHESGRNGSPTFKVRRAEMSLKGNAAEKVRYALMIDPAKSLSTGAISAANDNKVLQEATIYYDVCEGLEFKIGQFKTATTAEGLESNMSVLFTERSAVARTYGDKREPGMQLTYKLGEMWKLAGGLSNGQNTNVDDVDRPKDVTFRLDGQPHEMVKVGGFARNKNFYKDPVSRYGGNVSFGDSMWLFRTEGVLAKDNGVKSYGIAADVAYSFMESWQVAGRWETLDPDQNATGNAMAETLGINKQLSPNARIQGSFTMFQDASFASNSMVYQKGSEPHLWILNYQVGI